MDAAAGFSRVRPRWPLDERRRFLAVTVLFGFLFFSVSRNKLPGYLLPLLPSLFLLIASAFERRKLSELSKGWLIAPAMLIACIPLLAPILPQSLMLGRVSMASLSAITKTEIFYVVLPLAALALARRSQAATALALCVVAGGIFLRLGRIRRSIPRCRHERFGGKRRSWPTKPVMEERIATGFLASASIAAGVPTLRQWGISLRLQDPSTWHS